MTLKPTTTVTSNASAVYSVSAQSVTLSATVTSSMGTVNAGTVTFTVMQGSTPIGSPVTSGTVSSGAASVTYTLPGGTTADRYTIQAVYNTGGGFAISSDSTHTLTVGMTTATVTLGNLLQIYTGAPLAATASTTPSGLTVNLTYNGSSTAPTTVGSYTVVGTVSDINYQGSSSRTLVISKATPAITWATPAAIPYGTALSATQLDASSTVDGIVRLQPGSGSGPRRRTADPLGNFYAHRQRRLHGGNGVHHADGEQGRAGDYLGDPGGDHLRHGAERNAAQRQHDGGWNLRLYPGGGNCADGGFADPIGDVYADRQHRLHDGDRTVHVDGEQGNAGDHLGDPGGDPYGTALSATQLNASSTVAGTFVYTPAAGTVLTAGSQTLSVTFTPTDSGDYTTATATVTLTVNKATPAITWATPAAITYGTALSATQLDASSTVAGTFVYTPAAGTVLTAGSQTLSVTFTPTDSTDYTTATATVHADGEQGHADDHLGNPGGDHLRHGAERDAT